jgi:hypothetical protein
MGRAIISWKNLDSISTIVEGQNDAVAEQILIAIRDGCEKLLNTSEIPKRKIKEIVKNAIVSISYLTVRFNSKLSNRKSKENK